MYGGEIFSLYGPVLNGCWSKDALVYQVEIPCPKMLRAVVDAEGHTFWTFDGDGGTDKGPMWITVADRADVRQMPQLKFEKAMWIHVDGTTQAFIILMFIASVMIIDAFAVSLR